MALKTIVIERNKGDTGLPLLFDLEWLNGSAVDLTGHGGITVDFRKPGLGWQGSVNTASASGDATAGRVTLTLDDNEVNLVGDVWMRVRVVMASGGRETFPLDRRLIMRLLGDQE